MPKYRWEYRESRHFGKVWVPLAMVELRNRDGCYQTLAMQIDTGAVVSLLRRSVVEFLGVELFSGRRIVLGSVGEGSVPAFVHDLSFRFGTCGPMLAPFAIAESDHVPNLLGRLGILDRFRFVLDPARQRTEVSGPVAVRENR